VLTIIFVAGCAKSASGYYKSTDKTMQYTLDLRDGGTGSLLLSTTLTGTNSNELAARMRDSLARAIDEGLKMPDISWTQKGSRITVSGNTGAGTFRTRVFLVQDNGDLIEEDGDERFIRSK